MKSSYYISAATKKDEHSMEDAETMRDALVSILTSEEAMGTILKGEVSRCHSEAEVSYEEDSLIGKAVLDIEYEGKCNVDKAKLTAAIKKACPWKDIRVEKRLLPSVDLDPAEVVVDELADIGRPDSPATVMAVL